MLRRTLQTITYFISRAGGLLLEAYISISGTNDPETEFAILWTFGVNCGWLFRLRLLYYPNHFQLHWKTILFYRALEKVKAKYPNYKPKIHVRGGEQIADLLNANEQVVVITIHNLISVSSIIRVLKEFLIETVLIAVRDPQKKAEVMGCDFMLDTISRSKYAFLQARRSLRQGKWIVCCADNPPGKEDAVNSELLMLTEIFEFAIKTEAAIIFAVAQVSHNGEIDLAFGQIHNNKALSSNESANQFITFLDSVLTVKKKWKVSSWRKKDNI